MWYNIFTMGRIKRKIIQFLVRDMFVGLTDDDILKVTNRGWFMKGRKLSQEEVTELKEEATSLKESVLWNLMSNEIRYLANDRMFEKSAVEGNSVFGRAMLYNLNLLEQFIDRCKKL